MNKLVVVFGLFALTFFFGLGVTAVQFVTDSFWFPFDSGSSLDADDLFDSGEELDAYDWEETTEEDMGGYDEIDAYEEFEGDNVEEAIAGGWTCGDGTTIDGSWTNDGECDCEDCSDEYVFKCPEGKIINYSWIGDGDCDCNDCSDEQQGSDVVVCKGGEIIPRSYLNDGECDCNECDDES